MIPGKTAILMARVQIVEFVTAGLHKVGRVSWACTGANNLPTKVSTNNSLCPKAGGGSYMYVPHGRFRYVHTQ